MNDSEKIIAYFHEGNRGYIGRFSDDGGAYIFLDKYAAHEVEITGPGYYVVVITKPGVSGHYRFCRVVGDQTEAAILLVERQFAEAMVRELRAVAIRSQREEIVEQLTDVVTEFLRSTGIEESMTLDIGGITCEVYATTGSGRKIPTGKSSFICKGNVSVHVSDLPDDMPDLRLQIEDVLFYGKLSLGCRRSA